MIILYLLKVLMKYLLRISPLMVYFCLWLYCKWQKIMCQCHSPQLTTANVIFTKMITAVWSFFVFLYTICPSSVFVKLLLYIVYVCVCVCICVCVCVPPVWHFSKGFIPYASIATQLPVTTTLIFLWSVTVCGSCYC